MIIWLKHLIMSLRCSGSTETSAATTRSLTCPRWRVSHSTHVSSPWPTMTLTGQTDSAVLVCSKLVNITKFQQKGDIQTTLNSLVSQAKFFSSCFSLNLYFLNRKYKNVHIYKTLMNSNALTNLWYRGWWGLNRPSSSEALTKQETARWWGKLSICRAHSENKMMKVVTRLNNVHCPPALVSVIWPFLRNSS